MDKKIIIKYSALAIGIISAVVIVFFIFKLFSSPKPGGDNKNYISGEIISVDKKKKSFVLSDESFAGGTDAYTIETAKKTEFAVNMGGLPVGDNPWEPKGETKKEGFDAVEAGNRAEVFFQEVRDINKAKKLKAVKVIVSAEVRPDYPTDEEIERREQERIEQEKLGQEKLEQEILEKEKTGSGN